MSNKINGLTPDEWFEKFTQTLEKQNADYAKSRKESDEAFEKRLEKSSAEFNQRLEKSNAELEKWQKRIQKNVAGISDSNGDMAEEMIYNSLERDMTFCGIKFDDIKQNVPVMSGFDTKTEVDVLMVNGDTLAIIETKYKVENKDVTKLIKKQLADFRQCFPKYDNHKILLGIGGMSFEDKAIEEAKENGIGIIKIIGDKVEYYTEGIKTY